MPKPKVSWIKRIPRISQSQPKRSSSQVQEHSGATAGKSKQVTISKFFMPKVVNVRKGEVSSVSSDIEVIDLEDTDDRSCNKQETETVRGTLKRSSTDLDEINNERDSKRKRPDLGVASTSEIKQTDSSGKNNISDKTMCKLRQFSASLDSEHETGGSIRLSGIRHARGTLSGDTADRQMDKCLDDAKCDWAREEKRGKYEHWKLDVCSPSTSGTNSIQENMNSYSDWSASAENQSGMKTGERTVTQHRGTDKDKTKMQYTPLEKQFVQIKETNPDTVLFVECGYKYRFFGKDAEIAGRELNIYCHLDHNFMTASIPTHRLFVHVRRLVAKGYKVGVVKQMETAALKAASDNRSAPFTRQLVGLYTKSTLIGEDVDPVLSADGVDQQGPASSAYLMCVYEPSTAASKGDSQTIAIVAVHAATGDIIYDMFDDGTARSQLETCMSHIEPAELLVPHSLSGPTETVLQEITAASKQQDDRMRIERLTAEHFDADKAYDAISSFYQENAIKSKEGEGSHMVDVLKLPKPVICCFHALLLYLRHFQLDSVLKLTSNARPFSCLSRYMYLSGSTLAHLEVLRNSTDGRQRGSLVWMLNHTSSRFGGRLLHQWITKPLLSVQSINNRLDAVTELLESTGSPLHKLSKLLPTLPDLEKALGTIFHKKCSTAEFLQFCKALQKVYQALQGDHSHLDLQLNSPLLCQIRDELCEKLKDVGKYVGVLDEVAARNGDKTKLFVDDGPFPDVAKCKQNIQGVMEEIQAHRREVRLTLKAPSLQYVTVMQVEFQIEVKNNNLKLVPPDWTKITSTKAVSRFHTPFIVSAYKRLNQLKESLQLYSQQAWLHFLGEFESEYQGLRRAVDQLATLDCLLAFSQVASQSGFCRPNIVSNESKIEIKEGRHPVVDMLLGQQHQYVANDTHLSTQGRSCMVITGPNMGGKSSYIKQVALITILAQVGCYVPAESATLGVVDAIYTRMGASDSLYEGQSTFMVEMQEAGQMLKHATDKSLVILDELGRGTSTHDGVAIAWATLRYILQEVKCMTLFVTHYQSLQDLSQEFPSVLTNHHMAFLLNDQTESESEDTDCGVQLITFLYQLVDGMATRSYGLNVARLAHLPPSILQLAAAKSSELEKKLHERQCNRTVFQRLYTNTDPAQVKSLLCALECKDS